MPGKERRVCATSIRICYWYFWLYYFNILKKFLVWIKFVLFQASSYDSLYGKVSTTFLGIPYTLPLEESNVCKLGKVLVNILKFSKMRIFQFDILQQQQQKWMKHRRWLSTRSWSSLYCQRVGFIISCVSECKSCIRMICLIFT